MPHPFGPAVYSNSPNDLVQFDYVELGVTDDREKYLLMIRNDYSEYFWIFTFTSTPSEHFSRAIIDWSAKFGVPTDIISDGPTHLRSETVLQITKDLNFPHHSSVQIMV